MTTKSNPNYSALVATGVPFRIATQQSGKARFYFGDDYCEFWSNKCNSWHLECQAPRANSGSHLDRAMAWFNPENRAKREAEAARRDAQREAWMIEAE